MPDETAIFVFLKYFAAISVGLILGSFCTMLAYRLPRRLSIITPRSFCPHCKKTLAIRDLVPVFSYAINGGKCRMCHTKIGARYLFIELGLLAIALGLAVFFI